MKCPICNKRTGVIDTSPKNYETIRRRECKQCNIRFNTRENMFGKISSDKERKFIEPKAFFIRSEDDWVVRVTKSAYAERVLNKIDKATNNVQGFNR